MPLVLALSGLPDIDAVPLDDLVNQIIRLLVIVAALALFSSIK